MCKHCRQLAKSNVYEIDLPISHFIIDEYDEWKAWAIRKKEKDNKKDYRLSIRKTKNVMADEKEYFLQAEHIKGKEREYSCLSIEYCPICGERLNEIG